jgi:hypothetical protein
MEDLTNKQLAETELKNQFGFEDYVSVVPTPEDTYSNLVELPADSVEENSPSSVLNNINVTVVGENPPQNSNSSFSLEKIINNVFQNVTTNIKEQEVKKNSDQNSTANTGILNLSRAQDLSGSSELNDDGVPAEVEFVENIEELILPDANPGDLERENIAEIQMATYSNSPLKQKEPLLSQTNYTRNVTENIVNMANQNPEILMDSTMYSRNVYNTTNANFAQDISNPLYQQLSNMSNMIITNNTYNEMQNENFAIDAIGEINTPNVINPQSNQMSGNMNLDGTIRDTKTSPHKNPTFDSLISVMNEMNSPPIWRTVLG